MKRGHQWRGWAAAIAWIVGASLAQAGDLSQWAGCGYGPGYNSPAGCQRGVGGCLGCNQGCRGGCGNNRNQTELNPFGWIRGCCETPGTWRVNVWDGYHGDACTYRWSQIGACPEYAHAPLMQHTCAPGGSSGCGNGNACGNGNSCGGGAGYAAPNVSGYPMGGTGGISGGYVIPGGTQAPISGAELEPGIAPAPVQ